MELSEFAKKILFGSTLEDKLIRPDKIEFDDDQKFREKVFNLPFKPARSEQIGFSDENIKFPKGHFHLKEKQAIALHSFANHELLACEMMAAALLRYPHDTEELKRFKRGIINTIFDEQKHFKLYVQQLERLGYSFGDYPLNDFFWSYMKDLDTPEKYTAVMAMTFESANLDFATYYEKIFRDLGEDEIADVLLEVLKDEISHVGFGVRYLNKWREDRELWNYYISQLPWPLTPARSKGQHFAYSPRLKAGMPREFIQSQKNYKDEFKVTKRKEWKQ
ncbi:MAG: hypothetical protein CME62_01100 [Halobacteriovoraceae bacterium]|nr:hypothetical protein [Halobacteriovoraceae bacterium]|tara:strand:- start:314 stop:1144 length:831 start_codon:yes stop_codon:yes gene_type:complete